MKAPRLQERSESLMTACLVGVGWLVAEVPAAKRTGMTLACLLSSYERNCPIRLAGRVSGYFYRAIHEFTSQQSASL